MAATVEPNDIRAVGIDANVETWDLLQKSTLTDDEKDRMIDAAYASHYLWRKSGLGTTINLARGHWLISRVMCVTGYPELAERHAQLCKTYTNEAQDKQDFDEVYAIETEARVAAMNNDPVIASELRARALTMAQNISNAENRELTISDIMAQPWFGLSNEESVS